MKQNKPAKEACPMCGQGSTRVTEIGYKLKDENGKEFMVPGVEIEVCDFCGERIFNMEAVRKVRQSAGANHDILIRLKPKTHQILAIRAQKSKRSIIEEVHHLLDRSLGEA